MYTYAYRQSLAFVMVPRSQDTFSNIVLQQDIYSIENYAFLENMFFLSFCAVRELNVNDLDPITSRLSEVRQCDPRIHRGPNKLPWESQM